MSSPDWIGEIRGRCERATQGPWKIGQISSEWDTPTVETIDGGYLLRTTHFFNRLYA